VSTGVSTLGAGLRFLVFAVVTVLATMLLAFTITNVDTQPARSFSAVFSDAANPAADFP